jgi:hypothetical protein
MLILNNFSIKLNSAAGLKILHPPSCTLDAVKFLCLGGFKNSQ